MNTEKDFDSMTQDEQDQFMIEYYDRWKARQLAEQRNRDEQKKVEASIVAVKVTFVVSSITTVVFLVLAILS